MVLRVLAVQAGSHVRADQNPAAEGLSTAAAFFSQNYDVKDTPGPPHARDGGSSPGCHRDDAAGTERSYGDRSGEGSVLHRYQRGTADCSEDERDGGMPSHTHTLWTRQSGENTHVSETVILIPCVTSLIHFGSGIHLFAPRFPSKGFRLSLCGDRQVQVLVQVCVRRWILANPKNNPQC